MSPALRRWSLVLVASALALTTAALGGLHFATRVLKDKIVTALGPHGEVAEIRLGLSSVEIFDLRIKAAKDWPAAEELSAKRVVVAPELGSLLSGQVRVASIRVDSGYLSLLRRRDGRVAVLPSLLAATGSPSTGGPTVRIDGIRLDDCAVEFFDATVRQPPLKIRLEQVGARVGTIVVPALSGRTAIALEGVVKGVRRDGRLTIEGNADFASRDSEVVARLRGVDLLGFQPYLIKATDGGVKKGTLDLDLRSAVRNRRLQAPGTLTLSDLELASSGSFLGVPRATAVAMLKDKKGRIAVNFTLEGNLDDPRFSLNDNLSARVGTSIAGALGVSVEGLAKSVGTAGSSAAKTVGDAVGKLFGK